MSNPKLIKPLMRFSKKSGCPVRRPLFPTHFSWKRLISFRMMMSWSVRPPGREKTWIAVQTIRTYLSRGLNVWYASPLKALSNSIYQEFTREFGSASCGILTGDRKENADAP